MGIVVDNSSLTLDFGWQYGVMAELLGRSGHMGSEAVNCSAPDTGNMGNF